MILTLCLYSTTLHKSSTPTNRGIFYFPGDIHGAEFPCNFHFMELLEQELSSDSN